MFKYKTVLIALTIAFTALLASGAAAEPVNNPAGEHKESRKKPNCQYKPRKPQRVNKNWATGTAYFKNCKGWNVKVVLWPVQVDLESWLLSPWCSKKAINVSSSHSFELLAKCTPCQDDGRFKTVAIRSWPGDGDYTQDRRFSPQKKFACKR